MQHRQYFLMLERAPAYFWVEFFVQESKRFMVGHEKRYEVCKAGI
jgi:hypothetical protein